MLSLPELAINGPKCTGPSQGPGLLWTRRSLPQLEEDEMKGILSLAGLMALVSTAAHAVDIKPPSVPEIDALSGLAALAVVGAAVALIRERSK